MIVEELSNRETDEALALVAFWLQAGSARWFTRSDLFDKECGRFRALWEEAAGGAFAHWRETATGSLAYILLTDQIPRNIFRGSARQFETDALALAAARQALERRYHLSQPIPSQNFFLLPFQHSEDLAVQDESLDHYRALGDRDAYHSALIHHDAIRRFGRFPHRNAALGRHTTPAERAYLESGGFGA